MSIDRLPVGIVGDFALVKGSPCVHWRVNGGAGIQWTSSKEQSEAALAVKKKIR